MLTTATQKEVEGEYRFNWVTRPRPARILRKDGGLF